MSTSVQQYVSPLCDIARYSRQHRIPFARLAVSIESDGVREELRLFEVAPGQGKYPVIADLRESAKKDPRLESAVVDEVFLIAYKLSDSSKVVAQFGTAKMFEKDAVVRYFSESEEHGVYVLN